MSQVLNLLLGRAAEAFESREEEDALQRLLEAWRESRAEPLAVLAQLLSDRLTAGLEPLPCDCWSEHMERQRPVDLPRMLGGLLEDATRGQAAGLDTQLEALRRWPADPRLIPPLMAIARMPVAETPSVMSALCGLLIQLRDPHCAEVLREVHALLPPESPYAERLGIVIRLTASQALPVLDEETRSRCDELRAAIESRMATQTQAAPVRETLLALVYSMPGDVDARRVLADHLLELGEPLGEFIMLQCSPEPDEARIARLLDANRMKWEAPLGSVIERGRTRFERGFPVAARMSMDSIRGLPEPGAAWGTVEEIDWNWGGPSQEGAAWLAHPHLRGVTRLRRVAAAMARRLGDFPLPVEHLEMAGGPSRGALETFSTLARLPSLVSVAFSRATPDDVGLCAASLLGPRLERFEASVSGAWTLRVSSGDAPSVLAILVSERHCAALAVAIRGAEKFSTRSLRIRLLRRPDAAGMRLLEVAASAYVRADWE